MNDWRIEDCEREDLAHAGMIQQHGTVLLVQGNRISHAGANAASLLGDRTDCAPGARLTDAWTRLLDALADRPGARKIVPSAHIGPCGAIDLVAIRAADDRFILEFTPHRGETREGVGSDATQAEPSVDPHSEQEVVDAVAALTGFQRTMYYVFLEDGDGEVSAEARDPDVYGSYLGLRFPGSDVPQIARDLYRINPWRSIPDALADPVPLRAAAANDVADLSYSDLRSVSPMHRIYLSNMGVRASISFPVVIGSNLAGLVAAHHSQATVPPLRAMERAAALVRAHSRWLTDERAKRRMRVVDGLHRHFDALDSAIRDGSTLLERWSEVAERLCREFEADGATLCVGSKHATHGLGFETAAREAFDDWFVHSCGTFVWLGEHLAHQIPAYPASEVAGALALRVTDAHGVAVRLYLTRGEYIHEVSWGGNPDKPIERHDGQLGIAPRRSFETWIERRVGHARAWDSEARLLALGLRKVLHQRLQAP